MSVFGRKMVCFVAGANTPRREIRREHLCFQQAAEDGESITLERHCQPGFQEASLKSPGFSGQPVFFQLAVQGASAVADGRAPAPGASGVPCHKGYACRSAICRP